MFSAENLRKLASQQNLDSAEFAKRAKVNRTSIDRWMSGQVNPSPDRIVRLADALGVDASALYVVEPEKRTLEYYRTVAGFSLRQLADILEMAHPILWRVERGGMRLNKELRAQLAFHLKVRESVIDAAWRRAADPASEQQELALAV